MRLDKFLWAVRLAKTRSRASELIKKAKVKLNEVEVKAAKEVSIGNVIQVKKQPHYRTYKVLDIPESRVGAKLAPNFIVETTPEIHIRDIELLQLENRTNRQMGISGRPTKKNRRKLDDLKRP
ncbi:MAG: RNA-binding S4 domain-containing protein [Salibacteraceae bacterium]